MSFIDIYSPVQGTLQSLDSIDDAIFLVDFLVMVSQSFPSKE